MVEKLIASLIVIGTFISDVPHDGRPNQASHGLTTEYDGSFDTGTAEDAYSFDGDVSPN